MNFIFLLCIFVTTFLSGMEKQYELTNYTTTKHDILNIQYFPSDKRDGGNYQVGTTNHGKYFVSNSSADGTKVLVYFYGYFKESHWANDQLVLAHNPVSILDINTGINTPLQQLPELKHESNMPQNNNVRPLHMLDADTGAVGHDKKIHIIQKALSLSQLNIFKCSMLASGSKTIQILSPKLSESDEQDDIYAIDSSDSDLVAVSLQGCITKWPRNSVVIKEDQAKTLQCPEEFFSFLLNHKENLLCFGLKNGQMFVADLDNFEHHKTITLFPDSAMTINYLNAYNDRLLAGDFSYCKDKEKHCCKQDSERIDPTCDECKQINYDKVYEQEQTVDFKKLKQLQDLLEQQLRELNNKDCEHITYLKDHMPNICDYHKHIENSFNIQHSLFSAKQIKEAILKNPEEVFDLKSFLNKENFTQVQLDANKAYRRKDYKDSSRHGCYTKKSLVNAEVAQIQLISENRVMVYMINTYECKFYCSQESVDIKHHQIYIGNINHPNAYTLIMDTSDCEALHIIPTTPDNFVILREQLGWHIHTIMDRITKYTKNSDSRWLKNQCIKVLRLFSGWRPNMRSLAASMIPLLFAVCCVESGHSAIYSIPLMCPMLYTMFQVFTNPS